MKLKLVNIRQETVDVKTFFFEPEEEIKYDAGQYYYFTLPELKYDDPRGETRHFTLSSSPTEGKIISFTTKFPEPMSGYKKTLLELPIGSIIEGRGPQGVFTISPTSSRLRGTKNIFFAGGIGITPFRSMIKYSFDKSLTLPYLIYSNSDENFVFGDELKVILKEKLFLVNTSLTGHLDAEKIKNFISDHLISANFYVVGPPKFVDAMEASLEQLGIESGKILSEKFTGY